MWTQLRRKHLPPAMLPLHKSSTFQRQSQVWQTICDHASNTKRRFDSTRELLKTRTPAAQLYALHKFSNNLPTTHQRPATKTIGTALKKSKLPVPRVRLPVTLPYLSHPAQRTDTSQYLRQRITLHKQHTIPLYPPTTTVVFTRHPRVQDHLHNWRKLHRTWQPHSPPKCTCQQLHNKYPDHIYDNRVVLPLHKLAPDQHFLQYSGKSIFFPSTNMLRQALTTCLTTVAPPTPPPDPNTAG